MTRFHVLTAEFLHETNTFCKLPTNLAVFAERGLLYGAEAVAARQDNNTELGGFLEAGFAYNWNVTHVISAHAQPGGLVTREAFDTLTDPIVAAAKANCDTLDGILLGLHGAMVTDFCGDGEGELLRRLRAVVGPGLPIGITLDPHANVSRAMCDLAQIIVSFKTYPHTDMRVAARHAADILQRTMQGEIHPVTLRVTRPMLEEANGGRTDIGPMVDRLARARAYEQQADVFAVSINGAFPHANITEVGASVTVTAQGDMARHAAFASELADDIWARRHDAINQFHTVAQAAAICKAYRPQGRGPIIVADYADNVARVRQLARQIDQDRAAVRVVALKHAGAREIATSLAQIAQGSAEGRGWQVAPVDASNSLVLRGDPATLAKLARTVADLDQAAAAGSDVRVFFLNHADAEKLVPVLQQLVGQPVSPASQSAPQTQPTQSAFGNANAAAQGQQPAASAPLPAQSTGGRACRARGICEATPSSSPRPPMCSAGWAR